MRLFNQLFGAQGPALTGDAAAREQQTLVGTPPQDFAQQLARALGGGGLTGAIPAGAAGVIPGATAGASGLLAQKAGGGELAQLVAALVGGTAAAGAQSALGARSGTANRGARAIAQPIEHAGDDPLQVIQQAQAMAAGEPTPSPSGTPNAGLQGREALGPAGEQVALRVAKQGGSVSDPLLNRNADLMERLATQAMTRKQVLAEQAVQQQADISKPFDAQTQVRQQQVAEGVVKQRQAIDAQRSTRAAALATQAQRAFLQRAHASLGDAPGGVGAEDALAASFKPKIEQAYEPVNHATVTTTDGIRSHMDPNMVKAWNDAAAVENSRHVAGVRVKQIPTLDPTEPLPPQLPARGFDAMKKLLQNRLSDKLLSDESRSQATALLSGLDQSDPANPGGQHLGLIPQEIDPQVPGYAGARALAADYQAHRDALQFGRTLTSEVRRTQTRGQVEPSAAGQPDANQATYDAMPNMVKITAAVWL